LQVRLFAVARERIGTPVITVRLQSPATVAELREALASQHPELAILARRVMIAIDSEYAIESTPVRPESQVALIPPVSGGTSSLP
jgi:molybdopterin synthase catalytic subunit